MIHLLVMRTIRADSRLSIPDKSSDAKKNRIPSVQPKILLEFVAIGVYNIMLAWEGAKEDLVTFLFKRNGFLFFHPGNAES